MYKIIWFRNRVIDFAIYCLAWMSNTSTGYNVDITATLQCSELLVKILDLYMHTLPGSNNTLFPDKWLFFSESSMNPEMFTSKETKRRILTYSWGFYTGPIIFCFKPI